MSPAPRSQRFRDFLAAALGRRLRGFLTILGLFLSIGLAGRWLG